MKQHAITAVWLKSGSESLQDESLALQLISAARAQQKHVRFIVSCVAGSIEAQSRSGYSENPLTRSTADKKGLRLKVGLGKEKGIEEDRFSSSRLNRGPKYSRSQGFGLQSAKDCSRLIPRSDWGLLRERSFKHRKTKETLETRWQTSQRTTVP